MDPRKLIDCHTKLFHMAEAGAWPLVQTHGLLSTSALLDLFEVEAERRDSIERHHRPDSVVLEHSEHGVVVVRDQKPLNEGKPAACLEGMTVQEWYESLNGRTFFWLDEKHLHRLLVANAYRERVQTVITIDTAALIDRHGADITLSPINSGSTLFKAARRGPHTFLSIRDYPDDLWKRRGVAELSVKHAVPDIADVTIGVEEWQGDKRLGTIWESRSP